MLNFLSEKLDKMSNEAEYVYDFRPLFRRRSVDLNTIPPTAFRKFRELAKLTLQEAADLLGHDTNELQRWEDGSVPPPPSALRLMLIQSVYTLAENEEYTPQDLRNLRVGLKMSQSEFGKMLGVNSRHISGWEIGERPIPSHVWKRARVFASIRPDTSTFVLS